MRLSGYHSATLYNKLEILSGYYNDTVDYLEQCLGVNQDIWYTVVSIQMVDTFHNICLDTSMQYYNDTVDYLEQCLGVNQDIWFTVVSMKMFDTFHNILSGY